MFSVGEVYPFSPLLERILRRLYLAEIIIQDDFRLRRFIMNKKAREFMFKNSEKRLKPYIELFKVLGGKSREKQVEYCKKFSITKET